MSLRSFDVPRTALLVVDLQNDFLHPHGAYGRAGQAAPAIAAIPAPDGTHYWWEIILPGSLVGLIVGYATQRYGVPPATGRPAPAGR